MAEFNLPPEDGVIKGENVELPRFTRTHGFQQPFDVLQVLSWFIVAFFSLSFIGLMSQMFIGPWDTITLVVSSSQTIH